MSATLSAYELQRLENIRKNKEVLNDLGLNGGAYLHRSRDYFLDPLACAPKPKPTRKPSPPTPNRENRRYYTLLLRAWTPGVERIAHYTSTPDDMLYPIFLRVFPSKLDAEQIGAGGRGECSAARARMENESTTKTADPESGRPGNRAPQASAASARAPHGSRTRHSSPTASP